MIEYFSPESIELIGYYVYALVDPAVSPSDPRRFFYVGKGQGNRCFDHAREDHAIDDAERGKKLKRIHEIRSSTGKPPEVVIVAYGLEEMQALQLEALLIAVIPGLTNEVFGLRHSDHWLRAQDLDARYSKPFLSTDLGCNVLLVGLNGDLKRGLAPYPEIADMPEAVAERTLGNWTIGEKKAESVEFVVGVYAGLMRCVFEVEQRGGRKQFERLPPREKSNIGRTRFLGFRALAKQNIWGMKRLFDPSDSGKDLTKLPQLGWRLVLGR